MSRDILKKRVINISIFRKIERVVERLSDLASEWSGKPIFLFMHIVWWGLWMGFRVEEYPFGLLTLIVSLEAILLSGLILSSQNRQGVVDTNLLKKDLKFSSQTHSSVDHILDELRELKQMLENGGGVEK